MTIQSKIRNDTVKEKSENSVSINKACGRHDRRLEDFFVSLSFLLFPSKNSNTNTDYISNQDCSFNQIYYAWDNVRD